MPHVIHPMLATLVDEPFDNDDWLFEIKWDGYRAIAFIDGKSLRLVSRNQNDLTKAYPELQEIAAAHQGARPPSSTAKSSRSTSEGRPSFSLMQQRTGVGEGGRRIRRTRDDIPVVYYVFDLLYLDGYNLMRVDLEKRKAAARVHPRARRAAAFFRSLRRTRHRALSRRQPTRAGRHRRQAAPKLLRAQAQPASG